MTGAVRLDVAVSRLAAAASRARAQRLIRAGLVSVDGTVVTKPSASVTPTCDISVVSPEDTRALDATRPRGFAKLDGAFAHFGPELQRWVKNRNVIDIGSGAGGFTQRLLAGGARGVVSIDIGTDQAESALHGDERVLLLERTDFRALSVTDRHAGHRDGRVVSAVESFLTAGEKVPSADGGGKISTGGIEGKDLFSLCVVDVSFIPAAEAIEAVTSSGLLAPRSALLTLVKPQFQLETGSVPKSGVVRDPRLQQRALSKVVASAMGWGWTPAGTWRCKGSFVRRGQNTETFALFERPGTKS